MKGHTCQTVSKEELVDYADGELPPGENERISEHIAICSDCRAVAKALERSLQVTQAIWKTGQVQWPQTLSFDRIRPTSWSYNKVMCGAAGFMLIIAVGAIWQLLSESSDQPGTVTDETRVAELKLKIADAADADRLLAAADLLSKYPGAKSLVEQRYRYIIETYPDTDAATKARLKTK